MKERNGASLTERANEEKIGVCKERKTRHINTQESAGTEEVKKGR